EGIGDSLLGGNLDTDHFVELNLVGCGNRSAIAVVDFKLGRRTLRVVLLILESHRALHLGGGIDEGAQRIAGQRVIVAAGIYILELAGFVVAALGIRSLKEEALNLVGRIQRVAFGLEKALSPLLEHT